MMLNFVNKTLRPQYPVMAMSYEILFGNPIINDSVVDTRFGCVRVWTLRLTDSSTMNVGLSMSKRSSYFFFVVDGKIIKHSSDISPEIVNSHSQSTFDTPDFEHPSAITRLIQLGWNLFHVRYIDNSQQKYHVPANFAMVRCWFLSHPTKQLIIKIDLFTDTYYGNCQSHWSYNIWRNGGNIQRWLGYANDYITASGTRDHIFHDFKKEPDWKFANIMNGCPADPLPFRKLWCYGFAQTNAFPDDNIHFWEMFPIQELKKIVKHPTTNGINGEVNL